MINKQINTRMKKRIYWVLLLFSAVGVISACILTFSVGIRQSIHQIKQNICNQTQIICTAYDYIPQQKYVKMLEHLPENMRATLIAPDGTVVFDSLVDVSKMEDHSDRPEIQEAMQNGTGEVRRESSTINESVYYYAMRLSDGYVLRLSQQYFSIESMVLRSIPGILIVLIVLVVLALLMSKSLTIWMIRPVEQAAHAIRTNKEDNTTYDELTPFVSHIRAQDRKISDQKQSLKQERETLGIITNNMREGLMLVSKNKNVISINPSAVQMLNGRDLAPKDLIGLHYRTVNRTGEMDSCINTALHGTSKDALLSIVGKIYHIYASPMIQDNNVDGVVVIVLDETEQRMAERSRREFSANVSHELKTPLTSISGYAEMIENGMVLSKEDIQTFSGIIHKEALRLIALIEDIIRLSRIEESSGESAMMEPVDLNALASGVLESLVPIAKKTGVHLHLSGEIPSIPGEDSMLSEMLYNLTENAIKYNKPNGDVWVTLIDRDGEVEINVRDTGIGIPTESQLRVFERFYRVDKSRSKQIGGTGLGLSIVKHVVEYHVGRIELDSTPNNGTEIRIYLPK